MTGKRKSPNTATIRYEHIDEFDPLTNNQALAHKHWLNGKNLILSGSAGTGKTYTALHFAMEEVLERNTPYERVVIIRSIVPTRDVGFLPGDEEEKKKAYMAPYSPMLASICNRAGAFDMLTKSKVLDFESTSFIRGLTLDNTILVVDEMQNLNFHELDSVITRIGLNSKIIFAGDYHQSDFRVQKEKAGIKKFLNILKAMKSFETVEFGWEDIIRSDLVRDYIMTKEILEKEEQKNEKTSNRGGS